jgi:hypothetical protein
MAGDNKATKNEFNRFDGIKAPGGGFGINTKISKNDPEDSILDDMTSVEMADASNNFLKFHASSSFLNSAQDFHNTVGWNYTMSVANDAQFTFLGEKNEYLKGGGKVLQGQHDPESQKAAQDIQTSIDKIHKQKVSTTESTKTDIPCPTCSQLVASERGSAILAKISQTVTNLYPPFIAAPFRTFVKIINGLHIPMLDKAPNNTFTKNGDCSHPNCKNGTLTNVFGGYDKANQEAKSAIQGDTSIQENEKKLGEQADAYLAGHNVALNAGHYTTSNVPGYAKVPNSSTIITGHESNGGPLTLSAKGNPKERHVRVPHDHHPIGNVHVNASSKLDLSAGSNGVSVLTKGHTEINAGSIDLNSHTSELRLIGAEETILKGRTVSIDADDRSGDGGVHINSKNTHVSGKLSVGGDLSVTGLITMDGTLYAPNLVTKSMSMQTEPSNSAQSVAHGATWNSAPPLTNPQATQQNVFSEAVHIVSEAYDYISGANLTTTWLYNCVKRKINLVKLEAPLDNQGMPTGIATVLSVEGKPLLIKGIAHVNILGFQQEAPVEGIVIPEDIFIYNSPHNHDNISGIHTHQYVGHEGMHCDTTSGFQAMRPSPSHVPTPPIGAGTGSSPADSGSLPITVCGGLGGLMASANSARNSAYGIAGSSVNSAYNGNYVDVIPSYNPDGTLNPAPQLSLFRNCSS